MRDGVCDQGLRAKCRPAGLTDRELRALPDPPPWHLKKPWATGGGEVGVRVVASSQAAAFRPGFWGLIALLHGLACSRGLPLTSQ